MARLTRLCATTGEFDPRVPPPCTIPRLSLAALLGADAREPTAPALISGLQELPGWYVRERWRKSELLRRYGNISLRVGDTVAMGAQGPEVALEREALSSYVTSMGTAPGEVAARRYSFDRSGQAFAEQPLLRRDFALPPLFAARGGSSGGGGNSGATEGQGKEPRLWDHMTLSIGASGTGLGFHFHDAAINA